ncbi:MAG: TIGR02147 family protein [Pseudobdellovibrionaceae bacterium]
MTIFEFTDYKKYIQHFIRQQPKKGRGYILKIAEFLNMHPTHVSQILSGSKDFSHEQAFKMTDFLLLNALERDYFLLLVQKSKSGNKEYENFLQTKIVELQKQSLQIDKRISQTKALSDHERSIFYSSWLYSAIRLFCSLEKGKNLNEICIKFHLDRKQALEIIRFLLDTSLLKEVDNFYQIGATHTHVGLGSPYLNRHHTNWRLKALSHIEQLHSEELMFTGPVSVSKSDFKKIREKLLNVITEIVEYAKKEEPAEELVCLNIDYFFIK